ncbi:MAG: flippase [Ruminococcus sp.]|nr:flippase [Ruminococcus sp.]
MANRVLKNASWIVGCKIVQSIITFLIGMLTARYLGPSNYGLISYASSVVAFALPIMQLGFNSTLVQEFIEKPEKEGKILGTCLTLNILSAIASIVGVTSFAYIANPDETETVIVCFLYSLTLLFQAVEMTQYWFQAKLLSKYPSIVALIAYVVVAVYKIYILVSGKSIRWFAVSHVIEVFVIAILLIVLFKKLSKQKLSFSWELGKQMFNRSKYYITSSIMVVIFQQTDRIMLKLMLDEAQTGYYSAAITCIGITSFVFSAIIDSARPSILESKVSSKDRFEKKTVVLFSVITALSLAQSIGMTLLSKPIILIVYGEAFLPAVPVLSCAVWFVTFGYYGMVRNIWILAEGQQKYLWIINLCGAVMNVIVNLILIPLYGAVGAAVASVITQFFTNFVLCFVIKPIRKCGYLILKSFNPKNLVAFVKKRGF